MLIPDPCFIESIRRGSGAKRVLIHVSNTDDRPLQLKITEVAKPEWLDIEGAMLGDTLSFRKKGKLPLIVNINTDHRFFPSAGPHREELRFEFDQAPPLTVYVYLQEVIAEVGSFRGTFAIDFGTTNTCYAWKERVGDTMQMSDALKPPQVSREVPTLIRFKDISNRAAPVIEIGNHARDFIAHNSGRSFSYVISVKRMLGLDKELVILDDRSGLEPDRYQRYKPEEIAGFFIRELLREAESRIGQRIEQVVATFPILYNRKKQEALRAAFRVAFEGLNRPWSDERLILRLDETNAAAFNYIYGQLMDEFRRFSVQQAAHRLLSYDFGGGTVDVSLLDVELSRDSGGRITIRTRMLGVTGDRYFGGDIVTLAVLKLLKLRLVQRIAKLRMEEIERARKVAEQQRQAKAIAENPWALPVAGAATATPAASSDPWATLGQETTEQAPAAAPPPEEDEHPETADIECRVAQSRLERSYEAILQHGDVIDAACQWGVDLATAVSRLAANGSKPWSLADQRDIAQAVEDAVDTILPTRWKRLEEAGDLITKETARKLFYELWLPAEVLKIKAVSDPARRAQLTEPLHKIAKYAGVRPEQLMGVEVSEDEINAAIEPQLRRSIGKAAQLLANADQGAASGGLSIGFNAPATSKPVTILLAGNSARLPIVRRLVCEICRIDPERVVMDPNGVKATVAQGACEEHILRRDFGSEGGLITYVSDDFTARIPYTIGLFHRELTLLGYAGGFAPVMPRGTPVGSMVLLTDALQVVHAKTRELTLYAYYHDHILGLDAASAGAMAEVQPTNLGWFDLAAPEPEPWSESFAPEIEQQLAHIGSAFALVLVLDANRQLTLVNPRTRQCYRIREAREVVSDQENPFSGVH
ncbi:MAG: Hsp70 family protein [Planctomycetota bacterium]|nr:Hsp70 family protein [Planctomycetota bacterium]